VGAFQKRFPLDEISITESPNFFVGGPRKPLHNCSRAGHLT